MNPLARVLCLAGLSASLTLTGCGESFERYDDADAKTASSADASEGPSVREVSAQMDAARDAARRADNPHAANPHAPMGRGLPAAPAAGGTLGGTVLETIDASQYTYVLVDTDEGATWAAAPQFPVGVGAQVRFGTHMPMHAFRSTSLDRTFDLVYFVDAVDVLASASASAALGFGGEPAESAELVEPAEPLEVAEGGQTVATIFANAQRLTGRSVTVRGRVVKFNSGILGRNWIHIQDGTGEPGSDDLTVTTDDVCAVGDTVLVLGTLTRDRDFGAGYVYDLIVEDARVTVE